MMEKLTFFFGIGVCVIDKKTSLEEAWTQNEPLIERSPLALLAGRH
jgi:hypothetical protein